MPRSGKRSTRRARLGQSRRCTDTPRPLVTKPEIRSGGAGLQQRASCVSRRSTPTTRIPPRGREELVGFVEPEALRQLLEAHGALSTARELALDGGAPRGEHARDFAA